jgi:hypothetical protein
MRFASRQKRMMLYGFGIGIAVEIAFGVVIALIVPRIEGYEYGRGCC